MASGVPIVFRSGSGNLTFNVDYLDYAQNAGYKRYYACGGEDSAADVYFLTTKQLYSSNSLVWTAAGNETKDLDFDITFNNPVYVAAADLSCSFTQMALSSCYTIITIYHVTSGGTETSLGTKTTKTRTGGSSIYRECLKIPLTAKGFAVGEKLRLNVQFVDTDAGNSKIYHDPASGLTLTETATARTVNTDFYIDVPFRVDI